MYAYIKDGVLDCYSEEFFQKPVPEQKITVTLEAEDGSKSEKIETVPEVPGLVYDEAVEFDFDDVPVLEDGTIVPYSESKKKLQDDAEKAELEQLQKQKRISEIRSEIGVLAQERNGLLELQFSPEELEETNAKIEKLKEEYNSLNS